MEEDNEWSSDPSDVRSGSATGFSDDEDFPKIEGIFHAKPLNRGSDPVYSILDKIDAELNSLSRSQSSTGTGSTVVRKTESANFPKNGPPNEEHGSVSLHSERSGSFKSSSDKDNMETVLKLSKLRVTTSPREMESLKIFGSAEIYSDATDTTDHFSEMDTPQKNDQPSDLDSVTAKQIDDKFKEILKRKKELFARYPKRRGGYLENLKVRMPSDTETIKTEEYEDRFRENMVYNSGNHYRHGRTKSASPMRAFQTEDKRAHETKGFSSMPPIYPKTNQSARLQQDKCMTNRQSKWKPGNAFISDAESINTEDFETRFQDILQKQSSTASGAHNPILSDSDKDDQSDLLHTRVEHVLGFTSPYKMENSAEKERKRKYRRCPERSKSEPLKMFPTHIPLSFSKDDFDEAWSDETYREKEPISDDNRHEKKRRPEDTDSVIEERNEIARVSKKIQKEMNEERRARSKSPTPRREARSPTRVFINLSASQKSQDSGDENLQRQGLQLPENRVKFKSEDWPRRYSSEVPAARDLEDTEQQLKEARSQLENTRSQIMFSKFKHDNTLKDLQQANEELDKSKKQIRLYDEQIRIKLDELHKFDSLGLSQEEIKSYMSENESLKSRVRNVDAIELERDELVHQLELAKDDLFSEQKHSRSRIEELQEELENVTHLLDEHQGGKDDLSQSLLQTEETFRQMEREKEKIIQEKTRQCDELKDQLKRDHSDSRKRSAKAVGELHSEMTEFSKKIEQLQDGLSSKENENLQLREQFMKVQHHLSQEEKMREAITEEHKKTLVSLRKETDNAVVKMRESLFLEKQWEVESLRKEMDEERRSSSSKTEEQVAQQKVEYAQQLMAKTDDIQKLQHLVKRLDEDKRKMEAELQKEAKEQVKEALLLERQTLEAKSEWMIKQECDKNEKNLGKLKDISNLFEQETRFKDSLLEELQQARVQLEEAKLQNKHISHEKLVAVARAKDLTRQETLTDVDRLKERLKQEHRKEVEKLREIIKAHEGELLELRAEKHQWVRQERESTAVLNRTERTVINEINEECRQTANLLGITPRKVQFPSFHGSPGGMSGPQISRSRPLTSTALANLRACNEELRSHVQELKQELEAQRVAMAKASQEKEEGIKNLKKQLEREKVEAMKKVQTDLVKSATTTSSNPHNFNYFPYDEGKSLNHTFDASMNHTKYPQQEEIDHLEHEISKMALNQNKILQSNPSGEQDDIASIKMMNKLQDKVRQLRSENNVLRHAKLSVSVPDLSNPVYFKKQPFLRKPTRDQERMMSALQQRLKTAEMDSETAAEQQQRNRSTMSQKMAEITKLQTTLTSQTQDLLQLERAYSHLNNHYSHPHVMSAW